MDSLEEDFPYTLMGKYNLMLYPYITGYNFVYCKEWQLQQLQEALLEFRRTATALQEGRYAAIIALKSS